MLTLEPIPTARYDLQGLIGERLAANLDQWLLIAPQANPAMLEMFRDRDRLPRRDLVGWAGEFAGKYLTSAVLAWRLTPNPRMEAQLRCFVDDLIATQDADGYLGPFPRHERLTGKTAPDAKYGRYGVWDLWGHYHCILGLFTYHQAVGYEPALAAGRRAADYICGRFLDTGERAIQAGNEEKNLAVSHAFGLLYQTTGEPRYLRMLREIEADWQTPPAGDYVRTALAGLPFHATPKPRWESLPDVQAILSLYEITGDEDYRRAFEHIWHSIVATDRHNTGAFSSAEQAVGNPYDPRAIETCCTVAWMALTVDMLRLTGDPRAADELELATLNATLGSQSPTGRWWTYDTPMDGVRKASAHSIVFQAREGSPELNCCSVNGPRGLGMLANWAVMQGGGAIVVNYYGPGSVTLDLPSGRTLRLVQETGYPREGRVEIRLGLDAPERFALRLRIPGWSQATRCRVNGAAVDGVKAGNYLALERAWTDGDRIVLDFDMAPRAWVGEREAAGKVSLYRGPLLLAYDRRFNDMDSDALPAVDPGHLDPTILRWNGPWPAPWLLLEVQAAGGRALRLCDFATAGAAGTPYVTWLPVGG